MGGLMEKAKEEGWRQAERGEDREEGRRKQIKEEEKMDKGRIGKKGAINRLMRAEHRRNGKEKDDERNKMIKRRKTEELEK